MDWTEEGGKKLNTDLVNIPLALSLINANVGCHVGKSFSDQVLKVIK